MAIVIQLGGLVVDNPFIEVVWDIDFAAGGEADMVFLKERQGLVTNYTNYFDAPYRYWNVQFTPPVAWASIEGKNVASLFEDGITILGAWDDDRLLMTDFAEQVSGHYGDDTLIGRGGSDDLRGESGEDFLSGGNDDDVLTGGPEPDRFIFDAALTTAGIDQVTDFSGRAKGGRDRILLDADVFTALPGRLLKAKFLDVGNKKADDRNDYLIYQKKTGALYYDEDGSRKAHDPVKFALLDGAPKLSHRDFVIFDEA
jgi:Ca2+-binding RTX toxin-like protein